MTGTEPGGSGRVWVASRARRAEHADDGGTGRAGLGAGGPRKSRNLL